jgi:Ca2+-binding RTX toxin-like protein
MKEVKMKPTHTIVGTGLDDVITAGVGKYDGILGRAGDDVLVANTTRDTYVIGNGGDDSILGMKGDDRLLGGKGSDSIVGGTGDDRIHGGYGADWITGGEGSDVMRGGRGHDTFVFAAGDSVDTDYINGFRSGVDMIQLDGATEYSLTVEDGLSVIHYTDTNGDMNTIRFNSHSTISDTDII